MLALEAAHEESAEQLILPTWKAGALDVQDRPYDVRGCSALMHASNIALHRMVKLLLDKGANSELTTAANCNRTALSLAKCKLAEKAALERSVEHQSERAQLEAEHRRLEKCIALLQGCLSGKVTLEAFHSPVLSLPAPPHPRPPLLPLPTSFFPFPFPSLCHSLPPHP